MIRVLMTLVCCLFIAPAFSYDEEAKKGIPLSIFDDLNCSSHSIIISHFVSEVLESLEDDHTFELVLEEITFEDFQAFVEENFSKIKSFEEEGSDLNCSI